MRCAAQCINPVFSDALRYFGWCPQFDALIGHIHTIKKQKKKKEEKKARTKRRERDKGSLIKSYFSLDVNNLPCMRESRDLMRRSFPTQSQRSFKCSISRSTPTDLLKDILLPRFLKSFSFSFPESFFVPRFLLFDYSVTIAVVTSVSFHLLLL